MSLLKVLGTLLVLALVGASLLILNYDRIYPAYAVRYRLTVTVLVDGTHHSGSSVVEIRVKTQPRLLDSPPWSFRVDGEATFVDLGNGRNLVATLAPGPNKGLDATGILFRAFGIPFVVDRAADLTNVQGEKHLAPTDWPAFVTFRQTDKPLSIESVNPSSLDETLGTNVRIEDVTLTITRDAVTRNLAQNLRWLASPLDIQDTIALAKRHFGRRDFIRSDL